MEKSGREVYGRFMYLIGERSGGLEGYGCIGLWGCGVVIL